MPIATTELAVVTITRHVAIRVVSFDGCTWLKNVATKALLVIFKAKVIVAGSAAE